MKNLKPNKTLTVLVFLLVVALVVTALVPVWTVQANNSLAASAQKAPVTIYGNSLASGWRDLSWGVTRSLRTTKPTKSAPYSISLTITKASGALYLHRGTALSASGYTHLEFYVNGGTSGSQSLNIIVNKNTSKPYKVTAPKNIWAKISIPLASLGSPASITDIYWQDALGKAQPKLYIDVVSLVDKSTTAPSATVVKADPTATLVKPTATITKTAVPPATGTPTAIPTDPAATATMAPSATATEISPATFTPTASATATVLPSATPTSLSSPTAAPTQGILSGYFVAPTGNDANPGTQSQPWRTIGKAARTATAGNTIYVHGGVYSEQVNLSKSGTQASPIRFLAYPGETPVIEGSGVSMANWTALLGLSGNWIIVSGFEVRNSSYIGVEMSGQYNTVDNVFAHHSWENGILARGDYSTVQNSRIWRNSLHNEKGALSGGGWASALTAARDNVDDLTDHAVLRYNVSWENWGEGISSHEANGTLIEGNIAYDNYSTNIYLSDTTNVLCEGNLVYMTPGSYTSGYGAHVGIMMGDELYKPASANNTVINNVAYGNNRNFFWWKGDQGGGLVNTLIANNTFVNSTAEAGVVINSGTHQNTRFVNNLTVQEGNLPVASIATNGGQLVVSHNLWSKTPSGSVAGVGDVVGDPKLAKVGSVYAAEWYQLLDGSPAIDKAIVLPEVTQDYLNSPRGSAPDLGAFEK